MGIKSFFRKIKNKFLGGNRSAAPAVRSCPLQKGSLVVVTTDNQDLPVADVPVEVEGVVKPSSPEGFVVFTDLEPKPYAIDVKWRETGHANDKYVGEKASATVSGGEVAFRESTVTTKGSIKTEIWVATRDSDKDRLLDPALVERVAVAGQETVGENPWAVPGQHLVQSVTAVATIADGDFSPRNLTSAPVMVIAGGEVLAEMTVRESTWLEVLVSVGDDPLAGAKTFFEYATEPKNDKTSGNDGRSRHQLEPDGDTFDLAKVETPGEDLYTAEEFA